MAQRGRKKTKAPITAPQANGSPWAGFQRPANFDDAACREFDRLAEVLVRLGVAAKTDPRLVVAAARTHSLIERAAAELGQGDLTKLAGNLTPMPHPMLAVLNTLTMRLKSLLAEMGLTPASAGLTAPVPADAVADAAGWDDLLRVVG